jgi:hypothetical protein
MYKVKFDKKEIEMIRKSLTKLDAVLWDCEDRASQAGELISDDDRNYGALDAAIGSLNEIIDLNR